MPRSFPNGRQLDNDVIDIEFGLLTNGALTSDRVSNDSVFRKLVPLPRRLRCRGRRPSFAVKGSGQADVLRSDQGDWRRLGNPPGQKAMGRPPPAQLPEWARRHLWGHVDASEPSRRPQSGRHGEEVGQAAEECNSSRTRIEETGQALLGKSPDASKVRTNPASKPEDKAEKPDAPKHRKGD